MTAQVGRLANRQANEALILGAGERVFARTGFNGATMAAIADEAGLPKANLHYYFGNKLDLYRAVLARTLHDWLVPMDSTSAFSRRHSTPSLFRQTRTE